MALILQYLPALLLVFCRITSFFVVAPIFSAKNVPVQFKIGLAFFVSLLAFSTIDQTTIQMDNMYIISIVKEFLVGLLLGFVAYLFFVIVQISGSFVDMQIGFSLANIIDPMTGSQSPIIGNFKFILATLLFLTFNGHHLLLQAIMDSYQWVPLSSDVFIHIYNGQVSEFLLKTFTVVFELAFQMAAPMIAALFLVDVGLGILARTAPQFNIFVIGVPIKIIVGLLLLFILLPSFIVLFANLFSSMFDSMQKLVDFLGG